MQININKFVTIISILAILNISLFFTVMGLLGLEYEGSESSNIYIIYVLLVAILSFFAYGYGVVKKGVIKSELIIIFIILFVFCIHILWVIFGASVSVIFTDFLILFVLLGMPGFFAAATIIKLNLISQIIKYAEVFFIVMACGIAVFSILPTFSGNITTSLAGSSYQALSYYSAFIFGMLLTYNIYLPRSLRFYWTSFIWYKALVYGLILVCILGCLIGGGRGAFILMITYSLISLFASKGNIFSHKELFNLFTRLFAVFSLLIVFLSFFWERDFVQSGFNRATQFISSDGVVDIEEGSSGRDFVYVEAIKYISERPLIGYGPFNFREQAISPHNLFLEVSLQFGIMGLVIFLLMLIVVAFNAINNRSIYTYWVLVLLLYPLVMLMFSGSYMHSAEFIFGISFLVMYRKDLYGL